MAKNVRPGKLVWVGWVMTLLVAAVFCMSASMKLMGQPQAVQMMGSLGWSQSQMVPLAILELCCLTLYLIPRISVLGAIILTGYLGGAIATHVRIGQPVYMHVVIGLFIWGGLYLREPRLRALLPLRSL
jgi:hypothetical protein